MNEGDIWLKINNSCAATADNHSRLPLRIRSSSVSAAIRRPSAAKHAARPRRTNNRAAAAVADTNAVLRRVRVSSAPGAGNRPQFHSSPEGTVPCTARTAFRRAKPAVVAAAEKALAGAVRTSHLRRGRAVIFDVMEVAACNSPARGIGLSRLVHENFPCRLDRASRSPALPLSRWRLTLHRFPRSPHE